MKLVCSLLLLSALSVGLVSAETVRFAPPFADHMVLPRQVAIPIRGQASPGEKITVECRGRHLNTVAAPDGNWQVTLVPMQAGGPFELTVRGASSQSRLVDVMCGEVWVCSGQSNMEFPLKRSVEAADAFESDPELRLFTVRHAWSITPQTAFGTPVTWKLAEPAANAAFSAVAWQFGRELRRELKIPVGLIVAAWSATRIEPWLPDVPTNRVPPPPGGKPGQTPIEQHQAHVLYNGMIRPLTTFPVNGIVWYQGESNRGDGSAYGNKLQTLIDCWRNAWRQPRLPFLVVQLAPYDYHNRPELLPELWEEQSRVAREIPGVAITVTNDLGDLKNIHPAAKREVGRRLARLALNRCYGQSQLAADSPVPAAVTVDGSRLSIRFDHAAGLHTRDGQTANEFELVGADGRWHSAEAQLHGDTVVLSAAAVPSPKAVRFAWRMTAVPNLVNGAGLPVGAFRDSASAPTR